MTVLDHDQSADAQRWEALERRDPALDGAFVYGVLTTGVYCRPSCPARRALRRNVRFFATPVAARAGGLRACKRCHPDEATPDRRQAEVVLAACRAIEAAETPPTLASLARAARLSPFHFHRLFAARTGLTPRAYGAAVRAGQMREGVRTAHTVTGAIYEAGFGSSGRFYAATNDRLGMTPTRYRDGGADARIRFAVARTSLGDLLVAATEKGLCAIAFGEPDALVRDLQDRFPKATLVGADAAFEATVAAVVGLVERPGERPDLPLDVRGTAFQERVWRALRAMAPGEVTTYAALAVAIGAPKAVRAVAGACAANTLALAVPCHRVVRTDGSPSGYRWGVERKRELLAREAGAAARIVVG